MTPKNIQQSIKTAVQKAMNDAAVAFSGLDEEVYRRFRTVMDKTGLSQGSEEFQRMMTDLGRRLQKNGEQVERRLEESVRKAIVKVRDPLLDDLASLKARAENLGQRVEKQIRRRNGDEKHSSSETAVVETESDQKTHEGADSDG